MLPYFNTSGPCIPGEHYMLPPERRLAAVLDLVEDHRYVTLHAPRQTGKTTSARWMVKHYNAGDRFCATWVDLTDARGLSDPSHAFGRVLDELDFSMRRDLPELAVPSGPARALEPAHSCILRYLHELAARAPRPLLVVFDEADGLVGEANGSLLAQIRHGYIGRSGVPFPASMVLMGQRRVRDYAPRGHDRSASPWLGTASPFNIAEPATLLPFTQAEVGELLGQHTTATGQRFAPEVVARIWALGCGHPWLTNALVDRIVRGDVASHSIEITTAHVEAAKETLIHEHRTHIDSLVTCLHDDRVQRILAPMLVGAFASSDTLDDDFEHLVGLGLVSMHERHWTIANPIYQEIIPRVLTLEAQQQVPVEPGAFVRSDGSLDVPKLMAEWQVFWRKDGHVAAEGFGYREVGPHLMLMAFLQRVVDGGGRITQEYGLGRGALDLLIEWRSQRHAIEVKLRRGTETEERALDQVADYLERLRLEEGWLVMFDLRSTLEWDERLTLREVEHRGKRVHLVGC